MTALMYSPKKKGLVFQTSGRASYLAMISAFEAGDPNVAALAQAMSEALTQADGHRERQLRDAWGLSPKEVSVTLHLIDGGTVATCAETLGVAESTVRTHLKSVFAKTGWSRQVQLPSLIQNNVGMSNSDIRNKD